MRHFGVVCPADLGPECSTPMSRPDTHCLMGTAKLQEVLKEEFILPLTLLILF